MSEVFHTKSSLKEETNLTETKKDPRVRGNILIQFYTKQEKKYQKKIATFGFGNNKKNE